MRNGVPFLRGHGIHVETGRVVLLGVTHSDTEKDARYIADKIAHLRVFEDEAGKLNLSLKDVGGAVLLAAPYTHLTLPTI
ncbi:hypothetical protein CWI61_08555, partial [Neisseria meningitidis]